ncbi:MULTISPECIES: Na+/H+ antiporter subunit E [unclassified Paracoccus (in: a-proteobacteria)]|uniref:Na+/H+ antiporter subunit E n=1 Tax=unclassified Paracoccus (in: a-proteobacteria) TaxID=2688777 RepID=UPI001601D239|nr:MULTISPECIES: Na+/H+ antiporter subunit E [unclassified Paracoccus (in: a-proteobacteria)]MBB1491136.1 Na+/H+ antiporter subunit E [Paracoccus sp. MC1854]MBB1497049.1 Na+/H+ antiporter subunit E [Paracoccus sp. MC1862]QQO44548.1 Na+/H+ antiporter subunit E [Paracoccus sp. MC1862]
MIRRILPHPVLSLVVALVWMLLVNRFAWGSVVFAAVLGLLIPVVTAPYWPRRASIRATRIPGYLGIVIHDIVKANIDVARIVLFMPKAELQPAWLVVPLDLTVPEAIAVLMGTITLTPGTVSCDMAEDGSALLVHALHCPDPAATIDEIKTRYEARLQEIFR